MSSPDYFKVYSEAYKKGFFLHMSENHRIIWGLVPAVLGAAWDAMAFKGCPFPNWELMLGPPHLLGLRAPGDRPLCDILGKNVLKRPACLFFSLHGIKITSKLAVLVLHLKGRMGPSLQPSLRMSFIHPNLHTS